MSRESIVFTFGVLILIVPFLGIPATFKTYFLVVVGSILTLVGYSLRKRAYYAEQKKREMQHQAMQSVTGGESQV
jgi:VIT1/CCC1 family predicted Fe2+/Mn2+ transporter